MPSSPMGIDPGSIFAAATGLLILALTMVLRYLGTHSNFDLSICPTRLIYAFGAVIIGGLGSLMGTQPGGVIIGVAQTLDAAINPEWQILAGQIASVVMLLVRADEIVRQSGCVFWHWLGRRADLCANCADIAICSQGSNVGCLFTIAGQIERTIPRFMPGKASPIAMYAIKMKTLVRPLSFCPFAGRPARLLPRLIVHFFILAGIRNAALKRQA